MGKQIKFSEVTLRENLPTDSIDYEVEVKTRVNNFLGGLVHGRFSKDSLNKELSKFFGTEIEVSETSGSEQNDDELSDCNFIFGMDIQLDKYHLYGYVDIYSEEQDPNVEMWNKQNEPPTHEFVNDFGNKVKCRPFTNSNWSGIEISVEGKRLGSMVGETLPDTIDNQEVEDFESRVTDWIIENE